jgi:hypothetical protein
MTYQHAQEFASLQGDPGQALIGVIAEEKGHEVVRYFTAEQEADKVNGAEHNTGYACTCWCAE